ncbi:MAG: hypothetical protein HFF08_10420 [Oscillospiraceae bacterium]|nr:hypothetical protein [Oscillospiraceae bacterium]
MATLILYPVVNHRAFVIGIVKQGVQSIFTDRHCGKFGGSAGGESASGKMLGQIRDSPVARSKLLKCQFNQRSTLLIDYNRPFLTAFFVNAANVGIANRRTTDSATVLYFLIDPFFDLVSQVL